MIYVFLTRFSYNLFTKTLLQFRISLLKRFIYRRVNISKILRGAKIPILLTKNQVKTISVHFIKKKLPSSQVIYCHPPPPTPPTPHTQEISGHKKNHADQEYFTCLLKKCSCLQHMSQNGHLQACEKSGFFFMVIFLVSSPT